MISALASLVRLGRAGFIFAREGVFGVIDPALVPPSARPLIRIVRLIERPSSGAAEKRLVHGADPARSELCQARSVSGDPPGRGRRRARPRSGAAAGPDAAVPAGAGGSGDRRVVRQAGQRDFFDVRSAGRRRLDRAGASRRSRDHARAKGRRRQSAAAQRRASLSWRSARFHVTWRAAPKSCPPRRGGCGWSKWSTPCGARSRWRWTSAWRPRRSRKWPRTPRTIRISASRP